jgi:two-component system chemotaxis sensor kinase CheA
MDVVRRNIENIHGKVEVRSEKDKGTIVTLKIPLTLAIVDGMITRVGNNLYVIPIIAIKESLKADLKHITRTMDGQEIINIRGQLIPIIRIHEIFNTRAGNSKLEDGIIIVVENEQKSLCLYVDEVIRQQQVVIKGLSNYIGNIGCVSGCTILGDGDISLILDIAGIMNFVENGQIDTKIKV